MIIMAIQGFTEEERKELKETLKLLSGQEAEIPKNMTFDEIMKMGERRTKLLKRLEEMV